MRQPLHEGGVFYRAHAVVNAFGMQNVQRAAHVGRRAFFAGVGNTAQPQFAGLDKYAGKFFGRVPHFGGVQPHTNEMFAPKQGVLQGLQGRLF